MRISEIKFHSNQVWFNFTGTDRVEYHAEVPYNHFFTWLHEQGFVAFAHYRGRPQFGPRPCIIQGGIDQYGGVNSFTQTLDAKDLAKMNGVHLPDFAEYCEDIYKSVNADKLTTHDDIAGFISPVAGWYEEQERIMNERFSQ